MANSGVNTGCAKCFIVFMAIVILLQGGIYLGLSIWGLTRESCQDEPIKIYNEPFEFAMDLIYFADRDCGAPQIDVYDQLNYTLEMDFDISEEITDREYIFFIVYIVISAVWVVTSFLVIATICCTVTAAISAVCYWPWFLAVIAGSVLDVVATVYHILDIVHTTSTTSTFEYIGVSVSMDAFSSFGGYFVTPAVVMTCISSRLVVIWLLNIFGTGFCLSISKTLAKSAKTEKRNNVAPIATQVVENTQIIVEPNTSNQQQQQPIQQQQVPLQQQYVEQYPPQIKPKPLIIQAAIMPVDRQNSYQQQQQQQQQRGDRRTFEPLKAPAEVLYDPSPSTSDPHSAAPNRQDSTMNQFPTYRNADTHPDKLDYPAQATPTETPRATSPELSIISPLNSRYSVQEGSQYSQQPPQRVNDELRSQLPWSYTSMLANPPPPPQRRVQSQMAPPPPPKKSMYPEVPEPDYTLHPQRNANSTPNNNEMNIQEPQSYSRW